MKFTIIFLFIIFISKNVQSNQTNEEEIISIHEIKSLDQLVLEQVNNDTDDLNEENIDVEVIDTNTSVLEDNNENNELVGTPIIEYSFLDELDSDILTKYFDNSKNIKSNVIKNEYFNYLANITLDFKNKKNNQTLYLIIKYFYEIGNISKAYNLINSIDLQDNEYKSFYKLIELNYLLSTFQLEEVCSLNDELALENTYESFILEKTDIFCLALKDNLSEADLLNSILLDTEVKIDQNFQNLYDIMINKNNNTKFDDIFIDLINRDLIFLYTAMSRIVEIPLNESFYEVDKNNLSIPIILNKATPISLRIKAANNSFLENNLNVDSLAALYQSVDFASSQLNNPDKTIKEFENNKELLIAYYYQLINIQIFPSERIEALINFWQFANDNNLEEIAYSLSHNVTKSIEINSENIKFSPQIATSYIYNKDYEKALEWIELYENNYNADQNSSYSRILLNLNFADTLENFSEVLSNILNDNLITNNKINEELMYILLDVLNNDLNKNLNEDYNSIFDNRIMPSLFILNGIEEAILTNNNQKFLLYSIISINNKDWKDLHPNHLKLLLSGYSTYQNGYLLKNLILEIFQDYNIL